MARVVMTGARSGERARRGVRAMLALMLGASLVVGCQKAATKEAAPEAQAQSASAGTCDDFVSKLCKQGGEESLYCASGKTLASVLPPSACRAANADFAEVEQRIKTARKPCDDLMNRLCQDIGAETDACRRVRAQTPQFPAEQCEQLMKDYPQIVAELRQQEAQFQPLPPEARERIAAKGAPSFGPEDAKVTIVEFSDFECPFCARAAEVVTQIRARYGDKVRFVFRQFPLPSHGQAHLAAQASLAAAEQGKFWEYHDLLFQNQRALTRPALEAYAQQVGMNLAAFKRALDAQTQKAAVDRDLGLGESVQVNGTPTVFINGKRVPNATDFESVSKLIEDALRA